MAIINYTNQIKYAGRGYLDSKMMPVQTVDDLYAISLTQRFEGLTITVLNDGNPQDYWLVGGTTNNCWIPKTGTNYNDLRLVLEEGFLKLTNNGEQLGDAVDFNSFFPESADVLCITNVDYTSQNEKGDSGIFMCFTYSDETKKYLDMSQFLSTTYKSGEGIVIDNNVISIDSALLGRLDTIETALATKADASSIEELTQRIADEESARLDEDTLLQKSIENLSDTVSQQETTLSSVKSSLSELNEKVEGAIADTVTNKTDIKILQDKVNAISSATEGSTPDGTTIGITDDEQKALYVKVLNKEGNILQVDTNSDGESGLYAFIPIFCEDEELND